MIVVIGESIVALKIKNAHNTVTFINSILKQLHLSSHPHNMMKKADYG